ncbi:pseudouridine synthase [Alkalisalibacterium limincola]|uniref:Pseudouridine synthase n=1 Tax=Alkalisalibacterium limincola TaxID=2699169 RepID=A0A5C8KJ22_9GAMM|nr:pseudouridine synthase [Alkalisalibacterium limincola]TXK59159.1 rRNA pseudouridine synthase [Alkalisalibacterium limincola]
MPPRSATPPPTKSARKGVSRVISRSGACSRSEAARWVLEGRVAVDGRVVDDPDHPVRVGHDSVSVDGRPIGVAPRVCIMLNKPRGLVTSASDEQGRDTVYSCIADAQLGWLAPVGRLDRASEGLLLMSNDPQWAAGITDPVGGLEKTYHVQVDALPDETMLAALARGACERGEPLQARSVALLRHGRSSAWLEVVLDEGRNRHIRRLMKAHGLEVRRLVRVAIGGLRLGTLSKGAWRHLSASEIDALVPGGGPGDDGRGTREVGS